jgi:hypothetical protein
MEPQKLKVLKKFKKGGMSKTRKGEEDFTTKKTSKDFNRGGKREKTPEESKVKRRPFPYYLKPKSEKNKK